MKYLKKFNESNLPTDYVEVMSICKDLGLFERGYTTTVNPDGTVDTNRHVIISQRNRIPVRFGKVYNDFKLLNSKVSSLEGCPKEVSGTFELNGLENLKSLEGGPDEVSKYALFYLKIDSLIGLPERVDNLTISGLKNLTCLEGLPKIISNKFSLYNCPDLWDPKGLKDVYVGNPTWESILECPLFHLLRIFGSFKLFQESLDYNYIRKPISVPKGKTTETWEDIGDVEIIEYDHTPSINLFRFHEALDELGVTSEFVPVGDNPGYRKYTNSISFHTSPKDRLKNYVFVDDDNRIVDFDGNPVDYPKFNI